MISHPEFCAPVKGGLFALVNRDGPKSGQFSETAWMTDEVVQQENAERRANDDPALWHRVQHIHVDDFSA